MQAAAINLALYRHVVSDIDAVGWERLVWLQEDMGALTLSFEDTAGRQHHVYLQLPHNYPQAPPSATVELPVPFK